MRLTHILFVLPLLVVTQLHAETVDADQEREALARIEQELAVIQQMTYEAERKKPNHGRVSFRYADLRRDLQSMRDGIREHVAAPRQDPRTVPALQGDYR